MPKFEEGKSGNPNGRPKGTSRTNELRQRLHSRSNELMDSVIDAAVAGDMSAMKMCLDRILPTLKPQESNIFICAFDSDLPLIDLNNKIMEQVDVGTLTASQASDLLSLIKLKTELSEAENKDNSLVKEKQWKKLLGTH